MKTTRELVGTLIPDGTEFKVAAGTEARVSQALGGSYTIEIEAGPKVRIEGVDGDAIGQPKLEAQHGWDGDPLSPEEAEAQAWEALKSVHDPEIPVNLVDLGLVYTLKMHKRGDGLLLAEVRMTLTAPGCGMGDVLLDDVRRVLRTIPGVDTIDAKIVFDPIWNPQRDMSDAAKLQLGML